jgi:hypothetical protein
MYHFPNANIGDDANRTADPGSRTAVLARDATDTRHELYDRLSACMCWDAMLICAWKARGVRNAALDDADARGTRIGMLNIIISRQYGRVFDRNTYEVASEDQISRIAPGSFLGFINQNDNTLAHAMIYIGGVWGVGTKNDCVFTSGNPVGWEVIDLRAFFTTDRGRNSRRKMVARRVEGQTIV